MTTLAIMILINVTVLLLLRLRINKHLYNIEFFVYWMFCSIPVQNAAALEIDLSIISVPNEKVLLWADTINRSILIPIVLVLFLNQYSACETKSLKWISVIIFLMVLVGIEWGSLLAGLFESDYSLWWSFPKWLIILILSFLFMRFFQFKLQNKE